MNKRKIKSFVLILLICTSLIQVGILWDYQGHGLPFNFLSALAGMASGNNSGTIDRLKQDVIKPYRIIVSGGLDEPHWVLNKGTDTQNDYNKLWSEGSYYLQSILTSENVQSVSTISAKDSVEEWGKLVAKKGIVYEFKAAMKPRLLAYLLNLQNTPASEAGPVLKMLVSPWDDINYNNFTVYLYDGNSKLQKYFITLRTGNLSREKYDELLKKLYQQTENSDLRSYTIMKSTQGTFAYPARQDIPIINDGSKFEAYQSINCSIPEGLIPKNGQKSSEIEKKFDLILGSEKDSYDITTDGSTAVTVKNLNNIYRFYSDGVMAYTNLSSATYSERLDEGRAYKNAMEFIEKMRLLPGNADLYLSGVQEDKDKIRLTFDYKINGVPLVVNYSMQGREKTLLKNAITIEADSKRVLSCWWILRNFEPSKEKKQYNINFVDLMDTTFKEYPQLKNDKTFSLKDTAIGYEIKNDTKNAKLEPSWFVYAESNESYAVKVTPKKGE